MQKLVLVSRVRIICKLPLYSYYLFCLKNILIYITLFNIILFNFVEPLVTQVLCRTSVY